MNLMIPLAVLVPFFLSPPVMAGNYREIEKACQDSRDFVVCVRAYKGLPPFPLLEPPKTIPAVGPMAIQVIPFQDGVKDKNFKDKNRRRNLKPWDRNKFNRDQYDLLEM